MPPSSFRISRRRFVLGGSAALAAGALRPRGAGGRTGLVRPARAGLPDTVAARVDPALLRRLALAAVDAAKAAGATYADVRLTRTVTQGAFLGLDAGWVSDDETYGVGVRCLVNGYWGFAASPVWTTDEMAALARSAAARAQANAKGQARPIEWSPLPATTGDWSTPLEIDPFTIPLEERNDFGASMAQETRPGRLLADLAVLHRRELAGLADWGTAMNLVIQLHGGWGGGVAYWRQEQAVATSEGTAVTQTLYWPPYGWERNQEAATRFEALLPQLYEESLQYAGLPVKPVELGRYDLVLDGRVSAQLVAATLGKATQLDRALGYEANASGTSYLGPDPLALLGSYQAASEHVTLTANRSMSHGAATVQWDAEGVVPEETTLIKNGVLVDYQTTREQAGWLAPYYQKAGKPLRSHGYAGSETALDEPLQHMPNLVLEPGHPGTPVAEMIQGVKKGIYWSFGGEATSDFQAKTGRLADSSNVYQREIVNGKLGARLTGCVMLFNAPEIWKKVTAVGVAVEAAVGGGMERKGQPAQSVNYTVQSVPLVIQNQTVIRG